jgi:hypothetical protein
MKVLQRKYILTLFPIISFFGGLWQGQFTYDGYHWGFMLSNALDLISGKTPYKEIFLEYGILGTAIHAITLLIFDKNILSLIMITCLLYSTSIYLIGLIVYKVTLNKNYSFFSTIVIFMIYPWPVTPWPNFISFFFTTIFCYFYLYKEKKYAIFSGISLALAYLTFTTVYNFIIIFFALVILFFILTNYKKLNKNFIQKNIYLAISFLFILIIFLIYLFINDLLILWISYQNLPFIQADAYNIKIFDKIYSYFHFLFIFSWKNFIYEPQIVFYTILFLSNIYLIIKLLIRFYKYNDFSADNLNLLVVNIMFFSLNFYAQLSDIDKFSTSLSLAIISLFFLINTIRSIDDKIIIHSTIIFISLYSFIFAFGLEFSSTGASRAAYYKDLKNIEKKYSDENTRYFSKQKWTRNSWHQINSFIKFQNIIKGQCNLQYGANLTSNTYYYVLLENEKIQVIPFFYKDLGKTFRSYFDIDLIKKIQNEVDNQNILLVTSDNNDKLINLENYNNPIKIDLNKFNEKLEKFIYIYYPKKCKNV